MENNPIKKGLHVLKDEFFSRCFYCKIYDIQKINNEYKISVGFHFIFHKLCNDKNEQFNQNYNDINEFSNIYYYFEYYSLGYSFDIYINNLNDILNIFDMKYTFFNGNIYEQIKENFNMNKEEFYIKQEILKLIKLFIVNRKQFFI